MALGKKELTVAVVVGIAGVAAAVHFFIFQQKAQTYAQTSQEYKAAVDQLANAEFIRDQQAFTSFKERTTQYENLATSVVANLNLQKLDLPTSPPIGAIDQWGSTTIQLLSDLNQRRQGNVRLTFLDQNGWNFPTQLADMGGAGGLEDKINRLIQAYRALKFSTGVQAEAQARAAYNAALEQLGISARETSNFYEPYYRLFFNSEAWIKSFIDASKQNSGPAGTYNLQPYYNVYGLQRFGQAVPALKKIWIYHLIRQALGTNANPQMLQQFGEALEIGIPLDGDEPLNSINKQLKALVDIIDTAGKTQVQEIQYATLMRPINVAKAVIREPGATPPPEATPSPTPNYGMMGPGMGMGMGMGMYDMGMGGATGPPPVNATPVPDAESVGKGAGIELWMVAGNSSLVRFYYDLTHKTSTYGLDDVYVRQQPQGGGLLSTATIEIITDVNLQKAAAGAAPPAEGVTQ